MRNLFRRLNIMVSAAIIVLLAGCLPAEKNELRPGNWRGEFVGQDDRIPFNFTVEDDTAGLIRVWLTNGTEHAALDSVYYKQDSIVIPIDIYDAKLIGKLQGDSLKGYFKKNQNASRGTGFIAVHGQAFRFAETDTVAPVSAGGTWAAKLISERNGKADTSDVVLLFNQKGAKLTGSILTTTGDYRYFEGISGVKEIKLSGFSGSNPSLIKAEVDKDVLTGELIGPRGKSRLSAVLDARAALPDPYSLTWLKKGEDKLAFTFPDLNGKPVSLTDTRYHGKVVIVTIMGSWCPNCVDEAEFLSPWYLENKNKGVEIIGLTFERKDDLAFARERVSKLVKRFGIHYDILFAGLADKKVASEKLPQINALLSFPTTFLIDRDGKVRKIHTGYTGPATGKFYEEFKSEFNHDVNALLSEKISASAASL